MKINLQDIIEKDLCDQLAKMIDKHIIDELINPYSDFNDPNRYKKAARNKRISREKKLKRILF